MTGPSKQIWQEDDVTTERVAELLDNAFIKYEIDSDGDFVVELDGYRALLIIDAKRKMLKLLMSFSLNGGSEEEKDAYANHLNKNYVFAGFHTHESSIVGEYYFTYDGGILPYHIVWNLRKFMDLVPDVTAHGDQNNLLGRDTEDAESDIQNGGIDA